MRNIYLIIFFLLSGCAQHTIYEVSAFGEKPARVCCPNKRHDQTVSNALHNDECHLIYDEDDLNVAHNKRLEKGWR